MAVKHPLWFCWHNRGQYVNFPPQTSLPHIIAAFYLCAPFISIAAFYLCVPFISLAIQFSIPFCVILLSIYLQHYWAYIKCAQKYFKYIKSFSMYFFFLCSISKLVASAGSVESFGCIVSRQPLSRSNPIFETEFVQDGKSGDTTKKESGMLVGCVFDSIFHVRYPLEEKAKNSGVAEGWDITLNCTYDVVTVYLKYCLC